MYNENLLKNVITSVCEADPNIGFNPHYPVVLRAYFQIAAIAEVEQALKSWNIEQTDELLKNLEESKERRFKEEQEQQEKECNR